MTTATQCPTSAQLRAFSLGEMPEQECDELFQHLQDCPICKAELETFEDGEDSLIASLRDPSAESAFDREPDCQVAVEKAIGAFDAASETLTPNSLPKLIGEYELIRPLGHGGMGSVYLAKHTKLGRQLALKVLASHRLADARMKERFEAEMRAVGRLSHPNIVTAHDAREVDATAVLVTEYIDGFDLGELVSRTGPLKIADACEIICKVAAALQYISNQGFVHRDVKPSNIMVSTTGEVKLLDLGLARLQQSDVDITGTGQAMGTADFVAPEQIRDSRTVDARADIYSLGCTLFKLLTGHTPFATDRHATAFAKMTAHVNEQPPLVSSVLPDAPDELVTFVDRLLSKDPDDRVQTPLEVADALSRFASQSDLKKLVQFAAQVRPEQTAVTTVPTSRVIAQPWYLRPVPALVAIGAGMLGLVIGAAMAIIITIKYKDGTTAQIRVPAGSHVSIEDESTNETGSVDPNVEDFKEPANTSTINPDPKYSPLAFVVMVEADSVSAEALEAAKESLRKAGGTLLKTDAGYWYPLQGDNVGVPVQASVGGTQYGLAEIHESSRIAWPDIQGHVLSAQSGGGSNGIRMEFDDQLARKLETLTGNHLNKQLGVVIDHKIVSAPHVRSKLSSAAVISGRFTPEQTRFLMESIRGGLVHEPKRPEAEAAKVRQQMQGVWVMDAHMPGSESDSKPVGRLVINQSNFLFVQSEAGPTALGTIVVETSDGETTVEFRDMIGIEPMDDSIGVVRFPNIDEMHIGMQSPEYPDRVAVMVFRYPRPLPKSSRQFSELVFGSRATGDNELVDQIYNALLLENPSKADLEKLAEVVGSKRSSVDARNNLKMIALAFHNFHSAYNKLPGTRNVREGSVRRGPDEEIYPFSWRVAILPFIGQQKLFEQYRFDEPWDSEANQKLLELMPNVYRSPRAPENADGYTVIQGFATKDGIMEGAGHSFRDVLDGTSNTILVIESGLSVPWTKPQDLETTKHSFLKGKPILYALADGSVREDQEISAELLKKLISRDGGERIER